ncbi:MAG: DUF305 domain-containing protein [Balneolaceae bacterium]
MLNTSSLPASLLPFVLFIFIAFMGCSTTETATENTNQQQRDLSEMEALYWEKINESRMNFVEADVDFMTGMIAHHSQALIMSRLAPENTSTRSIQVLASRIINAQGDEIKFMQRWLRDRDQPVPEVHIEGLNMMIHGMEGETGHGGHGMHDHQTMPGMLTQDQLETLAAAEGREFDRLFLQNMIQHHEGAIIMVRTLFEADGAAADREAFELASGINAEQITEIDRMNLMLENIPDGKDS